MKNIYTIRTIGTLSCMTDFVNRFKPTKSIVVGTTGISFEEFLSLDLEVLKLYN